MSEGVRDFSDLKTTLIKAKQPETQQPTPQENRPKLDRQGRAYATGKLYHWHTGYIGGIKDRTPEKFLTGKTPERVVQLAVKRMLPRGPLGKHQFANLRVYAGPEHPHAAQQPEALDVGAMNPKNTNYRKAKAS